MIAPAIVPTDKLVLSLSSEREGEPGRDMNAHHNPLSMTMNAMCISWSTMGSKIKTANSQKKNYQHRCKRAEGESAEQISTSKVEQAV